MHRKRNTFVKKTRINKIGRNYDEESEYESKTDSDQSEDSMDEMDMEDHYGYTRINKIERKRTTRSEYRQLSCIICKKLGHTEDQCIFNKDPETRNKNQKRIRLKICLKCRSSRHLEMDCPKFKELSNTQCQKCQKMNKYEYFHNTDDCDKTNFLEMQEGN